MKYQGKITDPKDFVTKEYVDTGLSGKLGTSGDGSNVTAAFTATSSRTNISTGEKLSVIFGKIAKWFTDLGAAAFRGVDSAPTANSTNLVESGGVKSALDASKALSFTVTLTAAGWSNNVQTVSNANFLASGYSYLVAPNAPDFDDWCYCRIYGNNVTTDGAMTFTCANTPSGNITVNVLREVVGT